MAEVTSSAGGHGRGRSRRKRFSTRIDMTPMVDLAFLLLTFFMLTSQLMEPFAMEITMPYKPVPGDPVPVIRDEQLLTVVPGEDDRIYWYQGTDNPQVHITDYSAGGIRKVLFEKDKAIRNMYIMIKPSKKSRYKNVVDLLDEMAITGMKRYAIVKITHDDNLLIAKAGE